MTTRRAIQSDSTLALKACIEELNEVEPFQRRLALTALLASSIDRIRLLESNDDGVFAATECDLPPGVGIGEFWDRLNSVASFPKLSLDVLRALSSNEIVEGALVPNIEFLKDESGSVAVTIANVSSLDGENLHTLREKGSDQSRDLVPSDARERSFLSAQRAATFLGVSKSTVTRRINRNELIGFHTFTNALRIPEEQFIDGSVIPGISEILAMFSEELPDGGTYTNHKGAWNFLSTVVFSGDTKPRPIDRLKAVAWHQRGSEVLAELRDVKASLDYGDHI